MSTFERTSSLALSRSTFCSVTSNSTIKHGAHISKLRYVCFPHWQLMAPLTRLARHALPVSTCQSVVVLLPLVLLLDFERVRCAATETFYVSNAWQNPQLAIPLPRLVLRPTCCTPHSLGHYSADCVNRLLVEFLISSPLGYLTSERVRCAAQPLFKRC